MRSGCTDLFLEDLELAEEVVVRPGGVPDRLEGVGGAVVRMVKMVRLVGLVKLVKMVRLVRLVRLVR